MSETMANIQSLPNEILTSVLASVRDHDERSLFKCLFVSRRFYRLAKRLYYEHVCFDADKGDAFALSNALDKSSLSCLVRSFTICALPTKHPTVPVLVILPTTLRALSRLSTFSINLGTQLFDDIHEYADDSDEDEELQGWIPNAGIVRLISSLPSTVTNLEIDTDGWNRDRSNSHLCEHIGNLIPRLRVLRLRIHRVCIKLFHKLESDPMATSQLRQAVIRLAGMSASRHFCDSERTNSGKPARWYASTFARHLVDIRARGAFPWLEHFLVVNYRFTASSSRGDHSYDRIRDIATGTSLTVPSRVISASVSDEDRRYIFRDCEGRDLIGTQHELSMFVEGSLGWRIMPNGSRLPPFLGKNKVTYTLGTADALNRASKELPVGAYELMHTLWERERLVGAPTLRAMVTDDVDDERHPHETLPPGWKFFFKDGVWSVREDAQLH